MTVGTNHQAMLDRLLTVDYPFNVAVDPSGGYVIVFPDLPGCMTQVEATDEVGAAAREIRELWIETELKEGRAIPSPSYPVDHSGRFNLRIPKSLHRSLAESAARDAVSLNQYATMLLSEGEAVRRDRQLSRRAKSA